MDFGNRLLLFVCEMRIIDVLCRCLVLVQLQFASAMIPIVFMPLVLTSGFMVVIPSIPRFWIWLQVGKEDMQPPLYGRIHPVIRCTSSLRV